MRSVYPLFAAQRLRGAVGLEDLAAVDIRALAVDLTLYSWSEAHEFLASIPEAARVVESQILTGKTFVGGNFDCVDPVFPFPAASPVVRALVLFIDTGNDATSRLMYYTEDEAGLPLTPPSAGGNRTWKLATHGPFRL